MALVVKDRVQETTTTTGTGAYTLAGAVAGYQTFAAVGDGNTTYYAVTNNTDWEVGVGTYTAAGTTLARTTILASSNSNNAVNWPAGTKNIFVTYPADRSITGSASALAIPDPGTSGNVLTSNGTIWTSAAPSGGASPITIDNKTGAYTVVAGDLGKIINCTSGTFTVSLTAAATLGAGFNCWVWNTSTTATHAITIDPNGTETIDGASTRILRRGEGMQIVCDGTNWQTGDKKAMRGYAENISNISTRPSSTGDSSVAIGAGSLSSGSNSIALGASASTYNNYSSAFPLCTAFSDFSTAIGISSGAVGSYTATGAGAMALGGSYASGTDSFAAAIANNTSSYGATGTNSVAIGKNAKATASYSSASGFFATASATYAFAIGSSATASGVSSVALGDNTQALAEYSFASGYVSVARIIGKAAYASGQFISAGDAQTGTIVLRCATTNATATVLTSNNTAAATNNQVILPNNSTYTFRVQVVGMQQAAGGTNTAGYTFEGVIRRGANAAATVLKASTKTVLHEDDTAWDCNVSADTTNGGLAVTVTGAAATNIRWVATVTTSEVTYA